VALTKPTGTSGMSSPEQKSLSSRKSTDNFTHTAV